MTSAPLPLRKERDVGDVLNATFVYLKTNYKLLGKSLLLIVGPLMALSAVAASLFQMRTFSITARMSDGTVTPAENQALLAELFSAYVPLIGTWLFSALGLVVASAVVYAHMQLYLEHDGPEGYGMRDVWRLTPGMTGRLLLTGFVAVLLIYFLPALVIVIPCLGALAFFVWMVYASTTFSLVYPMRVMEPVGLVEGFKRCRRLIEGHFWSTLGLLILTWLLYTLLAMAVSVPGMILSFMMMAHAAEGAIGAGMQTLFTGVVTVGSVLSPLFYSIPLVAVGLQYFNLVERQEYAGLRERVAAMHEDDDAPAALPADTSAAPEPPPTEPASDDDDRWAPPRPPETPTS